MAAITALAFAWRGSWTLLGWVFLVPFVTLGQVGELLELPARVLDASPFTHVPAMPVEPFAAAPELALTAVAGVLLLLAWGRYRSRDIA